MSARKNRNIGDSSRGRSTFLAKYWLQPSQTTPTGSVCATLPSDSGTMCSTDWLVEESCLQKMQRITTETPYSLGFIFVTVRAREFIYLLFVHVNLFGESISTL